MRCWGRGLGTGTALICRVSFSPCGPHCCPLKVKSLLQGWGVTDQKSLLTVSLRLFVSLVNPSLCDAQYRSALWPECVWQPSHAWLAYLTWEHIPSADAAATSAGDRCPGWCLLRTSCGLYLYCAQSLTTHHRYQPKTGYQSLLSRGSLAGHFHLP